MFGWLRRRREVDGEFKCPHCGGWLATGMPNPHAERLHYKEFCTGLDPDEAARAVVAAMRRYDKANGR